MTHQNNFVVTIKSNNKILKEMKMDGELFYVLPFNSEYSIYKKNLSHRRVAVSISIDGRDVLEGSRIVLGKYNSGTDIHDLMGFMRGNIVKNKFKLIEKTEEISNHRGDRIDDGIIRIEYSFEKEERPSSNTSKTERWLFPQPTGDILYRYKTDWTNTDSVFVSSSATISTVNCSSSILQDNQTISGNISDGITVEGGDCNISYSNTFFTDSEDKGVISLKIYGTKEYKTPIFSREKITCKYCGRKGKPDNFCSGCGAKLLNI